MQKMTKKKVFGIRQGVWGADEPHIIYFDNKEAQQDYYDKHDYCDILKPRIIEFDEFIFSSLKEYEAFKKELY